MFQFDEETDGNLNQLEYLLKKTSEKIESLEADKNYLWDGVYQAFDKFVGTDAAARFVCQDGYTLSRVVRKGSPFIDESKLLQALETKYGKEEAEKLWSKITTVEKVVSLDQAKLAKLVKNGAIDTDVVSVAVVPGKKSTAKVRRLATKEDKEMLARGVISTPEQDTTQSSEEQVKELLEIG